MKDEWEIVFEAFCELSLDLKPYQQVWEAINHEDYGTSKFSQENEFTDIQSKGSKIESCFDSA